MSKPVLKLDWCGHDAAKFAVMHWHYSKAMPSFKLAKIGVWEDGRFIGAIVFGLVASPHLHKMYGLDQQSCCELVRIALTSHRTPVSRIVAVALRMIKRDMPGLLLVVSFADPSEGHHGGIYQAGGWVYTGQSAETSVYVVRGKERHHRTVAGRGMSPLAWLKKNVDPNAATVRKPGKYRYLKPLDDEIRRKIEPLRLPYPKRSVGSADSGTPGIQPGGGGANPTPTLSPSGVGGA